MTVRTFLLLLALRLMECNRDALTDAERRVAVAGERLAVPCAVGRGRVEWRRWTRHSNGSDVASASAQVDADGALVLAAVSADDEGLYRCTASLVADAGPSAPSLSSEELLPSAAQETSGDSPLAEGPLIYLVVRAAAAIVDAPQSRRVAANSLQDLQCTATGDPVPRVAWFLHRQDEEEPERDGRDPADRRDRSEEIESDVRLYPGFVRSSVRFNVTRAVNLTCRTWNIIAADQRVDSHMVTLDLLPHHGGGDDDDTVVEESGTEPAEPQGYCARYTGKICEGYLSNAASVWFNNSNDQTGGWLNEQLTLGLWQEVIKTLREPCQSAAMRLLCLYAFPECRYVDGIAKRLPLCNEDCIATRQLFCVNDWALLESNKQRGFFIGSRGHFRLPKCEQLPKLGHLGRQNIHRNGDHPPTCSRANLTELAPAQVTTTCVKGRGRFYQGNVSVTKEGYPCQRWDAQEPHSHNRPPLNIFPEMQGAENFCRNAGGEEPRPWCYTMDPLVRWQHCNIPQCDGDAALGTDDVVMTRLPPAMDPIFTPGFVLLLAGVGFMSLLILFLILLLCQRAFKYKQGYQLPSAQKCNMDIDLEKLRDNSAYHCIGSQINPCLEKLEYSRNDIIYIKDLGQGAFGRVFQAKAPNLVKGEPLTIVAVKTLKEEADDEMCANFEKEATLLAELDHPNIIRLLGVCAVEKPMCLLLEFMAGGDLREYLRSCSPTNYVVKTPDGYADVKLSSLELTSMGRQIAAGMVYLSQRGFVHRDLATRNCLVSEDMTVKIADFGLSQRVHWQNYYCGTDTDAIPIRWMPLESILFNRYTTASDVWAFGVCLWEIFSFALQPYYGMSHEEVVRYLQGGQVLEPPPYATCAIYAVMRSCWKSTPGERPEFEQLHDELAAIEEALSQQRGSTDTPPVHV